MSLLLYTILLKVSEPLKLVSKHGECLTSFRVLAHELVNLLGDLRYEIPELRFVCWREPIITSLIVLG
jgi:hypothetical protein